MCKRVKLLALLFCLFIFQSIDAQSDYCFQLGTSVNLSALDFSDCNGALTYDISEAGADDCTGCDNIQNFTIPGNIIVTAYEGGEECDEITVTLVNGPDINLNVVAAADCNEITFDGNFPETVTDWSWDFNDDDDEDANSESGIYVYTENGSIEVELTVTYSQGCLATSTQNIDVNGPIADLLIQGNPEGDVEFESIFTTTFAGNSCTIPFCVDDIENTHSIILDDNTANFSSTNQSFTITLEGVGVLYTNSVGLPPSAINYDFPAGASGFYELTYEVVDQDGCSHIKTYQVYISEFSSPDTDLVNITAQQDAYCVGENLQFELTADSQNPEDVTYYFAIGCNTPVFNPAGYVFLQEYNLAPDEAVLIDWPADVSSCQCPNDRFTVYTYVDNPCQTEPLEGATQPIEVALDTSPDFDAPDILCVGDNMDFLWEGAENLGNSYCGPDLQWNITAPDLTIIDGGDDEDINFTFDQVGTYTVCLEIEGCGGAEADILCETICVQELLTTSSPGLVATFPTASVYCINEIFEPTITLPPLFCEPPTVTWSVTLSGGGSANGDYSIDDNNSLTPTITFTDKGDYVVRAQVFSECGNPSFTSTVVSVGGPPTVHADAGVLTSCPDEVLCFDESFCVDDCNANFTTATVTVYEGTIANCSAPIANTIAWQSGGNPLVSFPADMQGAGCLGSNNSCNFSWLVPAIPLTDYTVVVEVINACGTDVACMPINVIVPGSLTIPVPAQVCAGYTIDPQTTALSNCNWLINGSTVWSPGNTNLVTINAAATVTVNCTLGACPQSVSKDVTVFPAINPDVTGGTVICQSGSVNLSASSDTGTSFQWFEGTCAQWQSGLATEIMGETGGILEVTSSGTYAVQITDSNGCEACAQHSVTEESAPTESCADVSFCETETSNLVGLSCATVPVGGTIIWTITDESNGTVSTNIPNTYSVGDLLADYGALTANHTFTASYELTSANGCEYSGDYTITINQLGLSTVIIEESCFGSAFPLVGGVDANWNSGDLPAGTFSISGGNLNINGALTNGTYTGITYNDGCAQQPYQIVIFENPTVALLGDTFICNSAGSTQDISADAIGTGTISYQWNNGPCNAASAIPTETAIDYTVTTAGTYSVSVTDDNGCEACAEVTILLDEMPTESCADLSFCETETAEEIGLDCLTVPAGGTLTWDLTDSGNSNVSTGMAATFTIGDILTDFGPLTANETFTAAYTFVSANSCSYEGSYQVTIQNLGIGAIIDVDTCFLTDFNLAGGAGGTWTTGDLPAGTFSTPGGNLAINNLLTAGNYNGIGYDSGCSQQPYSITITDLPTVTITGEDHLCDLDNATQTITAVAGGEAPFSYQWAENTCLLASPIAAETSAAFTLNSEGTYSVLLTDDNGCEACAEVTILLDEMPTESCADLSFCETETAEEIGLDCLTVPAGGTLTWDLTDSGNSNVSTGMAATFTIGDILTDFGPLTANETFTAAYTFVSANSCSYEGSYQVTIQNLGIGAIIDVDTCFLTDFNLAGGAGGTWTTGDLPAGTFSTPGGNLAINNLLTAGNYNGIGYDSGCSQQPYSITITDLPTVTITGEDHLCDLDNATQTITAVAGGEAPFSYQWAENTCLLASPIAAETSAAFTLNSEGTYSVLLTDNNGCEACGDINVLLDASPTSSCTDEIFCENLGSELVDLSCVSIPAGSNSPTWTISHETNSDFPYLITAGSFSVDDLLTVFDPLEIAVQSNEVFNFYHQWISDDGCVYLDSVQVTILDESVELEQLDFCSGDELNLTQPNNGDWIWTAIPVTSADVIGEDDFIWNTTLGDAGSMYEMRYTSEAGCGAVDYEIQVNATPVLSISTPEVNMCILTSQDITIDSGIATDITIDYEFNTDTLSINTTDLLLDPTALAITDTDPGQLHFQGSLDYVTLLGGILTCSSEAFQAIDIIDTLSSLAVPSFICQGEEFDIDLCGDGIVDEFIFTLGGTSYTSADCPFEIPTLFGTQAYDLEATYGGVFALQCQVQDAGEITIQQQLVYDYEVISDPCAGGQEVQFTITSGNTTSITLLPGEVLSSDILEAGDVFTEVLTFTPADEGTDEQFDYAIEITDGVCTTEIVSDIAQFIAVPDLGISIDELISDFDGCGNDFLTMQISVPNTNFIDGTIWTIESDYFAFEELVNGAGLLLPDVIELGAPPLESSIVIIAAEVFNLCGSDADTVFHIMNPADIQLQVADLEPQVCPGETIQVNTTVNLDFYDLDVVITPAADIDWNPLTETLVVGAGVPSGDYSVEFTATGECGVDVATANFSVFEFFSAEFDITGFNCAEESIYFSPLNAPELSGFEWDFGDMTTANNQFPVHIYDDPGIYEVTLSAFHSGANCQVTFTDEVEIGGEQVTITPGNIGYCGASEAAYSVDFINPQEVVWSITNPYTSEVLEYFTESTPILYFDFDEDSDEVVEYLIGVYALDEFGCPSSQSVSAEVFPAPKAEIAYSVVSATSDVASNYSPGYLQVFLGIPCSDVQIDFFNNEAVNNCFWTNDLGEMCGESFDNCSTLSFCTDEEISGQLTIQVDNEYQCTATDVLDVEFICADEVTLYVPNSFTPNYDGINDVFEYTFRGVVEDFELLIFNRWGEVIFESNELYDYWDGSDERGDYFVADGVYNWKIIINSERTGAIVKKGHVSILR